MDLLRIYRKNAVDFILQTTRNRSTPSERNLKKCFPRFSENPLMPRTASKQKEILYSPLLPPPSKATRALVSPHWSITSITCLSGHYLHVRHMTGKVRDWLMVTSVINATSLLRDEWGTQKLWECWNGGRGEHRLILYLNEVPGSRGFSENLSNPF